MLTARRAPETTLQWTDDRESRAADAVTCLHDDLPGSGNFPQSDAREIGVVPLLSLLPFLLADHAPPAPPAAVTATPASGGIALAWSYGADPDLAGYQVFRATTSGGPYGKLTAALLPRPAFVDTGAPPGAPSVYVVHAVDTSGNLSPPSAEVAAAPG